MKPVTHTIFGTLVAAWSHSKALSDEQFIPEHILAYQVEGETHLFHQRGGIVLKKGQMVLARRNQFAKSVKVPVPGKEYLVVAVILTSERLRKYAIDNHIAGKKRYNGPKNILLKPDSFIEAYFMSLLPYIEHARDVSEKMASIKANEIIELLLDLKPDLGAILFDFAEPYRVDLEEFMNKNFQFNASIENYAKLSGRSLTGFKREFTERFNTTPGKWLKEKRLSEALSLLKQKNMNPKDIYLDLGFVNLSHFYNSFKQKYGFTPGNLNLESKQNVV
jgi:AraC-like DNA-binding protein